MTLRVGVIGVGAMGSIHATNVATRVPGARLEAIAEVNPKRAKSIAKRLGVSKVYDEAAELIADHEIDAVVIATFRGLHPKLIIDSARAGKHILCEKPLGSTLRECDAALEAVEKAGVKLQIGFHRRFDSSFAKVFDEIDRGGVGELRIMHMTSRDPSPVAGNAERSPEDLFLETTIHDLDMARYLSGSEIEEVFAAGVEGAAGLEGAVVMLRMANGVVATIDNHLRSAYGYDQRVEVFGTMGSLAVSNRPQNTVTLSDRRGIQTSLPQPFFAERYAKAYVAVLLTFVRSVSKRTESPVTGADGRIAVAAALACVESLRKGKPVSVSYSIPSR